MGLGLITFIFLWIFVGIAHADTAYPVVSYNCSKVDNKIVVSYKVLWDEEGESFLFSDVTGTYNPWNLVTVSDKNGYSLIVKTTKIVKSCALSTGTYKIIIEPNPGNYNLNGRCGGAPMNAYISVYRGKLKVLNRTSFKLDCFDEDEISEIVIQGTNGKVEIHHLSDPFALHKAIKAKDIAAISALLKSSVDPNQLDQNNKTPLSLAIEARNIPICELLIQSGAQMNGALSQAAYDGAIEIVSLLLKYHADVNETNGSGIPLVLASYAGNAEIVKLLISSGANLNAKDASWAGVPAVVAAAKNGHYEVMKLLLDSGADIDQVDNDPKATALMIAIKWSKTDSAKKETEKVIKLLIDRGTSTSIKDKNGNTALDYARQVGDAELVKLLENQVRSNK